MEESRRTCLPSPARRILASTTGAMVRAARLRALPARPARPAVHRRERTGARAGGPNRRRPLWQAAGVGTFRGIELGDVIVETERLRLRPWRVQDVPRVAEVMADERMHEFLALPHPYTLEDARQFVMERAAATRAEGTGLSCAVAERAGGRVAGSALLR